MTCPPHHHCRSGFTLVELAIVLTILALLIAGVLVGRDLWILAQLRSQISQVDAANAAIATFRSKYGAVPGDLHARDAVLLGMIARSGERGHGDGNDVVESCDAGCGFCTSVPLGCEVALFWSDLAQGGLLEGSFPAAKDDYVQASSFQDTLGYFPEAKLGSAALVPTVCSQTGTWLAALRITASDLWSMGGSIESAPAIPGAYAQAIDAKMDDGRPQSGQVRARRVASDPAGYFCAPDLSGGLCLNAAGHYKVTGVSLCQLNFRMGSQ